MTSIGEGVQCDAMLGQPRAAVVASLRRILRPLVRLFVGQGISYPFLAEILKSVYVETAAREFTVGGKQATDSRLTLLTGVHRKDIRRLRSVTRAVSGAAHATTLRTQIVGRWLGDSVYHDRDGKPRVLPRTSRKGGEVSFAALVESVSKNVRPRSVLDEFVRLGIASVDTNDNVRLVTRAIVAGEELDAKAFYFGEALHDHLAAGVHNLNGARPAWLERSVHFDELSPAAVAEMQSKSERLTMQVLNEINGDGMALVANDPPAPGQRMRMRLGVYFYSESVAEAAGSPVAKPKAVPSARTVVVSPAKFVAAGRSADASAVNGEHGTLAAVAIAKPIEAAEKRVAVLLKALEAELQ